MWRLAEWARDDAWRDLGGLLLVGHDQRQALALGTGGTGSEGGGGGGEGGDAGRERRGRGRGGRSQRGEGWVHEVLERLGCRHALGVLSLQPGEVRLLRRLLQKGHLLRMSEVHCKMHGSTLMDGMTMFGAWWTTIGWPGC